MQVEDHPRRDPSAVFVRSNSRPRPIELLEDPHAVGAMALRRLGVVGYVHDDGSVTCPRNNQVDVGWS